MFKKKKKQTELPTPLENKQTTPKKELKEEIIDFGDFELKKEIIPTENKEERSINGMDELIIDSFEAELNDIVETTDVIEPEDNIDEQKPNVSIESTENDQPNVVTETAEEVVTNEIINDESIEIEQPTIENQNENQEVVEEEKETKKKKKKPKKKKKEKKTKKDKDLQAIKDRRMFKFKKRKYTKIEDFIKYLNAHYLDIDDISKEVLESEFFHGWLSKNSGKYQESILELKKIKEKIEK